MKLFEPGKIGKLNIKNRVVMAPMGTGLLVPDAALLQRAKDFYLARARGGVGLIITGSLWISQGLEPRAAENIINSAPYLRSVHELAQDVHDYGTKIAFQLSCGVGRNAGLDSINKRSVVAPSPLPCYNNPACIARELTITEIEGMVNSFELAAKKLKDAGIDAVEVHAHDGYLMDEFMTQLWNKRTDKYGGDLNGRLAFPLETVRAIKRGGGANFPVIFRFGLTHYFEGGRGIEEGIEICHKLEAAGVDSFHIDAGSYESRYWAIPPITLPRGCMVDLAEKVKRVVAVPVITVGRLGYPEIAESALQEGKADFIALGRPLLADAEWPNKVKDGKLEDIRPCIGDTGCLAKVIEGECISCSVNPVTGREREYSLEPASKKKSVLVVGGGPGGMEAAIIAAQRGHKVTLWEKTAALGGNLVPASVPDFKDDYKRLINYLSTQVKNLGVTVKLNKEATVVQIRQAKPDVVFIATGSVHGLPAIRGVEGDKVVTATDLLLGKRQAGESIVIIGGGMIGCETALHLAQHGKKSTIVELLDAVIPDFFVAARMHMLKLLAQANVAILTGTSVKEINDKGVVIINGEGKPSTLEADTVVIATGLKPLNTIWEQLKGTPIEAYPIGDCVEPRQVQQAIWEGFRLARLI